MAVTKAPAKERAKSGDANPQMTPTETIPAQSPKSIDGESGDTDSTYAEIAVKPATISAAAHSFAP